MTDAEVTAAIALYERELGIPATDALTRLAGPPRRHGGAGVPGARAEAGRRRDVTAPRLEIHLDRIGHNARTLVERLGRAGHRASPASPRRRSARPRSRVSCSRPACRGTRRVAHREHRGAARAPASPAPITLIRSPMPSQVDRVVAARRREPQHRARRPRPRCRPRPRAAGPRPRRRAHGRARRPPRGHPARRPARPSPDRSLRAARPRAARASAPTSPARAAWPPTPRNMAELSDLAALARGHASASTLAVVSGGQLGQPRLGARRVPTSGGSTTSGSASRSCSGREPLAPHADRGPAHRRRHARRPR